MTVHTRWWDELAPGAQIRTLHDAFALWLQAVESENRSPQTILLYEGRCRQLLRYLESQEHTAPFGLSMLTADNVRRASTWLREHSAGQKGGASAARALVTTLKTASAWLTDEGVLVTDPLARVKRPKAGDPARTPFSQDEVRALVLAAAGSRSGARDVAMIHLLLDTGMRVGGLCSILLDDLNLRDRRLELRLKGGRRQTLYFGSPDRRDGGKIARALRAYLVEREGIARRQPTRTQGRLFLSYDGWPLQPDGVRQVLTRLARETDVAHVHPHRFRHTFATWYLVRHAGDETGLRGMLGHLSDDMYRTYVHISHELIAQRAGRTSLSEAWLGSGDEPPISEPTPTARPDLSVLTAAIRDDAELRKALMAALVGAA